MLFQAFMSSEFTADINVMDESILQLLQYWDKEGDFAAMGIFGPEPDMQNVYRHVIMKASRTAKMSLIRLLSGLETLIRLSTTFMIALKVL